MEPVTSATMSFAVVQKWGGIGETGPTHSQMVVFTSVIQVKVVVPVGIWCPECEALGLVEEPEHRDTPGSGIDHQCKLAQVVVTPHA